MLLCLMKTMRGSENRVEEREGDPERPPGSDTPEPPASLWPYDRIQFSNSATSNVAQNHHFSHWVS